MAVQRWNDDVRGRRLHGLSRSSYSQHCHARSSRSRRHHNRLPHGDYIYTDTHSSHLISFHLTVCLPLALSPPHWFLTMFSAVLNANADNSLQTHIATALQLDQQALHDDRVGSVLDQQALHDVRVGCKTRETSNVQ